MAVDPAIQIRRESAKLRVEQAGVTPRAIQASLKKTTREPKGIEVGYQAFLVSIQKQINALIRKQLPELFGILDRARVDSAAVVRADTLNDDVLASFETLRGFINNLAVKTDGVLRVGVQNFGIKTAQFNDAKYDDPLMNLLGIGDVSANIEQSILEGWVAENTQLVRNMNVEQVGKLETLFLRSLRDGSRSAQVAGDVSDILGGSVDRARLIARDQIGKLDGQLSQQKQTEAGIDGYAWRGALDGRERPSHVAREGLIFKWNAPPPDGHPGQPVQCRCSPEPDLSHLGEEFAPDPPADADLSDATPEARRKSRNQQAKNRRGKARFAARKEAASLKAAKKRTPGPKAAAPTPTTTPTPAPAPVPIPQTPAAPAIPPPMAEPVTPQQARGQAVAADVSVQRSEQRPQKRRTSETAFVKSVDAAEVQALANWKSNIGHKLIRGVQAGTVRRPTAKGPSARLDRAKYDQAVSDLVQLDRMTARAPQFKGKLHRGIATSRKIARQLATPGATLELETWTPFTTDRKVATSFGPTREGGAFVRYTLDVKTTPVLDARKTLQSKRVGQLSNARENESEILAPRGAVFRVKTSKVVRGAGDKIIGYNVTLEEV